MVRELIFLLSAASAFASSVQLLTSLPNSVVSKAIQLDAAGNIYLAKSLTPQNQQSSHATYINGTAFTTITGIAIDSSFTLSGIQLVVHKPSYTNL